MSSESLGLISYLQKEVEAPGSQPHIFNLFLELAG